MPDELAPPAVSSRPSKIECGFCGCQIAALDGEVLRKGAEAKAFQAQEEQLEKATRTIADHLARIAELEGKLKQLTDNLPAPSSANHWL